MALSGGGGIGIHIVSVPNLQKIESFVRDSTYRETLEVSASFNTRLCMERRMRVPFFDSQTGIAQNHSHLYMPLRRRMPGHREGQLYTYPASRWWKPKRQYLTKLQNHRPFKSIGGSSLPLGVPPVPTREPGEIPAPVEPAEFNASLLDDSSLGANLDTDSKDSHPNPTPSKEEPLPKDWYYDEMALNDDDLDDPEGGDSDYDYNINGYKRKGKRSRRPAGSGKRSRGRESAAAREAASADHPEASGSPSGTSTRKRPGPKRGTGGSSRKRGTKDSSAAAKDASMDKDLEDSMNESLPEPPSFDSAAMELGGENGENGGGYGSSADLRNYRKYL
ncbi:zinc finger protein DPF3 [Uranotaenia lowii]|uniref:zinc finger protein DPF3 n=1 Tax=Uranotaenia lowii TaxID=190385 RepID=UPI00247836A4|nr:zinc finger protein DPF3 [Uranotaenia lowii]